MFKSGRDAALSPPPPLSSSAQADDPVNAGISYESRGRGVLDLPVKPGDDGGDLN
jgi:hypothetical protein